MKVWAWIRVVQPGVCRDSSQTVRSPERAGA